MPTDNTRAAPRGRPSRRSVPRAKQRPPEGKGEKGRKANPLFDQGFSQIAARWYEAIIAAKYPPGLKDFLHAIARLTWGCGYYGHRLLTDGQIGKALGGRSVTTVQSRKRLALQYNLIEMVHVTDRLGHLQCFYQLTSPDEWIAPSRSGKGIDARFKAGVTSGTPFNGGVEPPIAPRTCSKDVDLYGIERKGPLSEPRGLLKVTDEEGERIEQARPQLTQLCQALRLRGDLDPLPYMHLSLDGARPDGPTVGSTLVNAVDAGRKAIQDVAVNIAGRGWLDTIGVLRPGDRALVTDGAVRHVYLCRVLAAGLGRVASEASPPGADDAPVDRKGDNDPPA